MDNQKQLWHQWCLAISRRQYRAANRAFGLINRLPLNERRPHYARVCARRNELRGRIRYHEAAAAAAA